MTNGKMWVLLALVFASGGGAGAYWSTLSGSEPPSHLPKVESKVDDADPGDDIDSAPQATKPVELDEPGAIELDSAHEDDPSFDEDLPGARSAADILWALERAYQSQEQRIARLEGLLQERLAEEQIEEAIQAPSADDAPEQESPQAQLTATASEWDSTSADTDNDASSPTERPSAATEVVVYVEAPVTQAPAGEPQGPAAPIVVHQPVYVVPPTTSGRPGPRAVSSLHPRPLRPSRLDPSKTTTKPPSTSSWVASGFDIYTKR